MFGALENMAANPAMSGAVAFAGLAVLLHAAYSAVECTRGPLLAGHRRAGLACARARAAVRT